MNDEKKGYPMFKMNNIDDAFLFNDRVRFADISDKIFDNFKLEKNDVLFNRVNSEEFVGRTGIFKLDIKSTFASYLIRLQTKEYGEILPDYLNIFLNSKYGLRQIKKFLRRAVNQANVNAEELKQMKIAILPMNVQKKIEKLSNDSWESFQRSEKLYQQAESFLLEELGLKDFETDKSLFSVVNLSEVKNANRIDAEYFHSKYKYIIKKIENYKNGWDFLENITSFINNGNQPPYSVDGKIKFFSQKWIKDKVIDYSFLTDPDEPRVSKEFFNDEKNKIYLIRKYDILYYSVGANLGFCHNYLEEENIAIGSFINLIRADKNKINPVYLGFALNSSVGRMQAEMNKSGLAQPYIYAKNLRKFKVPILSKEIQQKISDLVIKSHEARKKAKELSDEAKKKVEEIIEKGDNN
ncbi:MAG: restriction endonuclease subunit S [bacterium]|nr:restriction endonuclease subunit S [bacterium]